MFYLKQVKLRDNSYKYLLIADDEVVSWFVVELLCGNSAVISFETKRCFRNKGYASFGLNLLKDELYNSRKVLFFGLMNVSDDVSRKVAENASFFLGKGFMENDKTNYVAMHPEAFNFVRKELKRKGIKEEKRNYYLGLLTKIDEFEGFEKNARFKMLEKLNQLENEVFSYACDDDNYKWKEARLKEAIIEIKHIKKILKRDTENDKGNENRKVKIKKI